jgi:hypothetical protein
MDCVAEVPLLKELYSKYRSRGLEIVGISLDDEPFKVGRFVAEKGIGWPQICDGKADTGAIPKLYNVTGTPDLFVIDRAGNIAARLMSAKQLERQIAEVTASNAFPPRQQRDSGQRSVDIMERFAFALEGQPRLGGAGDGCFCVFPCGRSRPARSLPRISAGGVEKIAYRARQDRDYMDSEQRSWSAEQLGSNCIKFATMVGSHCC